MSGQRAWTKERRPTGVLDTDLRVPLDDAVAMLEQGLAERIVVGGRFAPMAVVYLRRRQ